MASIVTTVIVSEVALGKRKHERQAVKEMFSLPVGASHDVFNVFH